MRLCFSTLACPKWEWDRVVAAAQTFGFYQSHHSYSHFRAEVHFSGDLDGIFHVDVKKTTIHPNDRVLERIRHIAQRYIEQSGREGRERGVAKTKLASPRMSLFVPAKAPGQLPLPAVFEEADHGSVDSIFTVNRDNGDLRIVYNKRHPLIQAVAEAKQTKLSDLLHLFSYALAEISAAPHGQEIVDRITRIITNIGVYGTADDTWKNRDS